MVALRWQSLHTREVCGFIPHAFLGPGTGHLLGTKKSKAPHPTTFAPYHLGLSCPLLSSCPCLHSAAGCCTYKKFNPAYAGIVPYCCCLFSPPYLFLPHAHTGRWTCPLMRCCCRCTSPSLSSWSSHGNSSSHPGGTMTLQSSTQV